MLYYTKYQESEIEYQFATCTVHISNCLGPLYELEATGRTRSGIWFELSGSVSNTGRWTSTGFLAISLAETARSNSKARTSVNSKALILLKKNTRSQPCWNTTENIRLTLQVQIDNRYNLWVPHWMPSCLPKLQEWMRQHLEYSPNAQV